MPSQQEQLRELGRIERWQALRNWALFLALLAVLLAADASGIFGGGNPKGASSIFIALAGEGLLGETVKVLSAVAVALVLVAGVAHGLSKRGRGEV